MKIFQIVIKKITQIIGGGAANVLAKTTSGLVVSGKNTMVPAKPEDRLGVAVRMAPTKVVSLEKAGIAVSNKQSGTAAKPVDVAGVSAWMAPIVQSGAKASAGLVVVGAPLSLTVHEAAGAVVSGKNTLAPAKPMDVAGLFASNKQSGTPAKAQPANGAKIARIKYDLTHRSGSNSVTQTAVGGRSDWANITNAQGKHDGSVAQIVSNTLAARGGRLDCGYADFVNKTPLTITSVKLNFYVSQSGTLLNNGSMRLQYWNGSSIVTLETITGDVSSLTTPRTFDLTSVINTWALLNSLIAYVEVSYGAALTQITGQCDAVELEVIATATDTL